MLYQREQTATLLGRLDEAPERLIVIAGPRQVGKTTLVLQALERIDRPHRYLPVDEQESAAQPSFLHGEESPFEVPEDFAFSITGERDTRWLVRQWERARWEADRSERGFVLALDEVQKISDWPEAVKGLWDADRRHGRRLHVILLGSAPLLVQRGMSESLAGRYETIRLTHWSFVEMSAAFDFDLPSYVYFGGYPGAAPLIRDEDRWRAYVTGAIAEPNIERDILAMQRVDKPVLLKRLFELGARYSGQILSYTKMLGQLQDAGNTTTLARYLDLLATAGLIAGLPNHAGAAHRRRASSPKLNALNTALMTALSGYTFDEAKAIAPSGAAWSRARSARTCSIRERRRFAFTTGDTETERWTSSWHGGPGSPGWRSRAVLFAPVTAGLQDSPDSLTARPRCLSAKAGFRFPSFCPFRLGNGSKAHDGSSTPYMLRTP